MTDLAYILDIYLQHNYNTFCEQEFRRYKDDSSDADTIDFYR